MTIPNQFGTQDAPKGFALPRAAVGLLNTAALAGWRTAWQWGEDSGGSTFVSVHVGYPDTGEQFKFTWHSRGTGTLRLFSRTHQRVAGAPWTDGPSVAAARFRTREVADLIA